MTGLPIVNEKITLTCMQSIADATPVTLEGLWYNDWLEEMTNIHIDYTQIAAGDWDTQVNLTFATREYPDIMKGANYIDTEEYGVSQGILIRTDELIAQYCPILHARMMSDTTVTPALYMSDGNMYCLPNMMAQGINCAGHFFINRTWLDAVGMSVPKTVDELTAVLRAFRDQKPNGGGEIPWSAEWIWSSASSVSNALYFWGIPSVDIYISLDDNEKVVFQPYMDGFRECFEWLNMLYKEGLLDADVLTQENASFMAKVNDVNVGFFSMWRLINYGIDPMLENAEFMLPVAADGYKAVMAKTAETASRHGYITIANQNVPETMRWFDTQYDTDVMFSSYYGPEGIGWERDPATGLINTSIDNTTISQYTLSTNGVFYAPGAYYYSVFQLPPHRVEKNEYCKAQDAAGVMEKNSYYLINVFTPLSTEENERKNFIFTDLQTCMNEYSAYFIQNGVTDAKWNEFINNTKNIGAEEYVNIYQTAYDRKFK